MHLSPDNVVSQIKCLDKSPALKTKTEGNSSNEVQDVLGNHVLSSQNRKIRVACRKFFHWLIYSFVSVPTTGYPYRFTFAFATLSRKISWLIRRKQKLELFHDSSSSNLNLTTIYTKPYAYLQV